MISFLINKEKRFTFIFAFDRNLIFILFDETLVKFRSLQPSCELNIIVVF